MLTNINIGEDSIITPVYNREDCIARCIYIGPQVCIVENVIIGNNVTIGAGAIVTKDIPDNATVVGNPARVINYNNPDKYIAKRCTVV